MKLHHALTVVAVLGLPAAALAQDDRGASVSAAVSATNMDAQTELSFSGSFGYRFSRVVGLELEATVVPTLESPPNDRVSILGSLGYASGLIFPTPRFVDPGGRMVIFSNNVRITLPTGSTRLEPYFVAGGGIASVRHTADYIYPVYPAILGATLGLDLAPSISISKSSFTQHVTSSAVEMALTLGGGLSVRVASQLSLDADLRMFRLLGEVDRNSGRFGVGIRYRF